jgi:hypothetical protein
MKIKVTNVGQSKMLCPLNRDGKWALLPGQCIETYSDHYHLSLLEKLAEHKVIVEVDGTVIIDPRKPTKKRIKRVIVDSDLKLLDRIRALKYGMVTLNSKLRKKISDLEFKLATMVPGKDISALMNMIVDKADSEAKLGIFKRILRDNVEIRAALEEM